MNRRSWIGAALGGIAAMLGWRTAPTYNIATAPRPAGAWGAQSSSWSIPKTKPVMGKVLDRHICAGAEGDVVIWNPATASNERARATAVGVNVLAGKRFAAVASGLDGKLMIVMAEV